MRAELVLAIDQGTTSSRALVFDAQGAVVAAAQVPLPQIYPADGWVEHDPEAIWSTTLATARDVFTKAETTGGRVVAIGIANQRETAIVWDRATGAPLYNAVVWQDRRTAERCRTLARSGVLDLVRSRTGLLLDPYFSAAKIAWILDHVEGAHSRAERGELAFGTVDGFLVWRLTGGRVHATDATNASRTSLYDIHRDAWCEELCCVFGVPQSLLPQVRDSAGDYGVTATGLFGRPLPILGVIGDQQAAMVGQRALAPGDVKATFGTGGFVLVNTGEAPITSNHRLLTTIAYRFDGRTTYALEGSIFTAGAAVQWLRDGLGVIAAAAETEALAASLPDNGGVHLVPAFTGLGAPHWDPYARGALYGLTRATGRAHLARAALEAVAYQTCDLLDAMAGDGVTPAALKVDGGFAANGWAMQFLADVTGLTVERPASLETTARGAALIAGHQAGVLRGWDFDAVGDRGERFTPRLSSADRGQLLAGWCDAKRRTLSGFGSGSLPALSPEAAG